MRRVFRRAVTLRVRSNPTRGRRRALRARPPAATRLRTAAPNRRSPRQGTLTDVSSSPPVAPPTPARTEPLAEQRHHAEIAAHFDSFAPVEPRWRRTNQTYH